MNRLSILRWRFSVINYQTFRHYSDRGTLADDSRKFNDVNQTNRAKSSTKSWSLFGFNLFKSPTNKNVIEDKSLTLERMSDGPYKTLLKQEIRRDALAQSYIPERHRILGNDLATGHFIVANGGAVR